MGLETAAFEELESEVLELFEVLELGTLFQEDPEAELETAAFEVLE